MEYADLLDIIAFSVFMACVVVYAIEFRIGMKRPVSCRRGLLNLFYNAWVRKVLDTNDSILAVQTMRNLIMSVTFLSSTMLIVLGVMLGGGFSDINEIGDFSGDIGQKIDALRVVLLFSIIVFSLSMFLLSLRQMVRFSVLIGADPNDLSYTCADGCIHDGRSFLVDVFVKAMNRFAFGLRGLYFLVASMLWFINSYAFLVAGVVITVLLILYQDIVVPGNGEKAPLGTEYGGPGRNGR